MPRQDTSTDDEDFSGDSKTRRKKQMIALQELGQELTTLGNKQLSALLLPETLLHAVKEYQRLPNSNEAKRRQLQFIGRLMRDAEHEEIQSRLNAMRTPDIAQIRRAQLIESWGEKLLSADEQAINAFLAEYPLAERQTLRQILRNYTGIQQQDENALRTQRRKLLDYIKAYIN
ncbi:MAG: ribosome biogenesis factor YjgA [Pseudomonadales bacterium]|nr:ribosome biogenesis factor YjgA [Pseudomonadales bacterium]